MNPNSNIRHIDELGRIVIPKDIRKKLHINENEPLEIYIESEEIRIKKYSAMPKADEFINYLIDLGNRITNNKYIITNRKKVIAATDTSYMNAPISKILENMVLTGTEIKNEYMSINFTPNLSINSYVNILPIMIDGDRTGVIIEYQNSNISNDNIVKLFKNLIENKISNS